MSPARIWIRVVAALVPGDRRRDWLEEWEGELFANEARPGDAWGALADAWYLRKEGWTMGDFGRDLRLAVRSLSRKPFFTAVAGLTLAVGIAANAAIFSVFDAVLIDPFPFPEPERLVSYNHQAPGIGVKVPVIPHSEGMYLHYQEQARALEAFAVFSEGDVSLVSDGEPRRLSAILATESYFDVLGAAPMLGRTFEPGEDRAGAEPVVVLGHAVWEQSFASDPAVIGTLVEMDGVRRRVVGVMPAGFAFNQEELWIPLTVDDVDPELGSLSLVGIGRLAEGATVASANAEMGDLLVRYTDTYPEEFPDAMLEQIGLGPDVKPIKDVFVGDFRQALWVVLGTVGMVLLIACANVANLFLVRAEGRLRERALRTAMGAGRGDLVRQALAESFVLTGAAGLLGLGMGAVGVEGLLRVAPTDLPAVIDIGLDGSVVAFTAALTLATGLLFGLLPGAARGPADLAGALKDGSRSATSGRQRHRVRSGLVVAQIALALVLLVGSGLMLRSFAALRGVDLGFQPESVLTFRFTLPEAAYAEPAQVLDFHRRLTERLATVPGVPGAEAVGMINGIPLGGSKSAGPMEPEDRPFPEGQLGPVIERRAVTPGYFSAMGIRIVDGRGPAWEDQGDEGRGVVISAALAESFWPGRSAVGERIRPQGSDEPGWQVVGVADDVRHDAVSDEPAPIVYLPALNGDASPSTSMDVVLRVDAPLAAVQAAREALREADPRVPMIRPRTLESVVDDSLASTSFTVLMLGIAAAVALLLGTVGIYGVVSYVVSRRTQEIGVRMALGAPAAAVLREVMKQGLVLTGAGVAVGLLGAWAMSRALSSLLFGVEAVDPITFAGTALLLTGVAALATWLPARKAARVDPVEALRSE